MSGKAVTRKKAASIDVPMDQLFEHLSRNLKHLPTILGEADGDITVITRRILSFRKELEAMKVLLSVMTFHFDELAEKLEQAEIERGRRQQ